MLFHLAGRNEVGKSVLEPCAAFVLAKFPSRLYEPLGLRRVFNLCLCFFRRAAAWAYYPWGFTAHSRQVRLCQRCL
jgi:hypothetical protein